MLGYVVIAAWIVIVGAYVFYVYKTSTRSDSARELRSDSWSAKETFVARVTKENRGGPKL